MHDVPPRQLRGFRIRLSLLSSIWMYVRSTISRYEMRWTESGRIFFPTPLSILRCGSSKWSEMKLNAIRIQKFEVFLMRMHPHTAICNTNSQISRRNYSTTIVRHHVNDFDGNGLLPELAHCVNLHHVLRISPRNGNSLHLCRRKERRCRHSRESRIGRR